MTTGKPSGRDTIRPGHDPAGRRSGRDRIWPGTIERVETTTRVVTTIRRAPSFTRLLAPLALVALAIAAVFIGDSLF